MEVIVLSEGAVNRTMKFFSGVIRKDNGFPMQEEMEIHILVIQGRKSIMIVKRKSFIPLLNWIG